MCVELADGEGPKASLAVSSVVVLGMPHGRCSGAFELVRAAVAQGGVPTSGVVPVLDEPEHGHARLDLAPKRLPVDEFALQGAEGSLGHGVVEAIVSRPGGGQHPHILAALAEGHRRVLETLVGMMDHPGGVALAMAMLSALLVSVRSGRDRADESTVPRLSRLGRIGKRAGPRDDLTGTTERIPLLGPTGTPRDAQKF